MPSFPGAFPFFTPLQQSIIVLIGIWSLPQRLEASVRYLTDVWNHSWYFFLGPLSAVEKVLVVASNAFAGRRRCIGAEDVVMVPWCLYFLDLLVLSLAVESFPIPHNLLKLVVSGSFEFHHPPGRI